MVNNIDRKVNKFHNIVFVTIKAVPWQSLVQTKLKILHTFIAAS